MMGGPGWSGSGGSVGHSSLRPGLVLHTTPWEHSDSSTPTLPPRRGRPYRWGRASVPSGQWRRGLEAGAGRPRCYAPSGGCFKMADVAGPSRPGAAAFWSRDCILCPPGRGRRRPPRCGERRAVAWGSAKGRRFVLTPGAGPCCPAAVQVSGFAPCLGIRWRRAPDTVSKLGFQVWGHNAYASQPSLAVSSGRMAYGRGPA